MESTRKLLINSTMGCTRIALVENDNLIDLFIDRPDHKRMVGNIYKGKVQNIIPGMQAAFVDIGYSINAFLPFTEISEINPIDNSKFILNDKNKNDVKYNLEIGDFVIVQVIKEAFSGKGPRVTTNISIPGNLMVLVPNSKYIGVSKKIYNKYEKKRLKDIIKNIKGDDIGIIMRTISSQKEESLIQKDYNNLHRSWKEIKYKIESSKDISLIFQDFTTSDLVIRDLLSENIKDLIIDYKPLYKRIYSIVKSITPNEVNKVQYYKERIPIFDKYKVEDQINKCLQTKAWMKSGAYLIIEHTEAMVVIDVNSGRFIGKGSHEENSLKINLESAREIVKQLRIRDIGGLVVIDFIDLAEQENRKKVYNELKKHLKKDRAKSSLSEFSNFGLMQMTRQRIGLSLADTLMEPCSNCNGNGKIKSLDYTLTEIENWIKRFKAKNSDRRLIVYVHKKLEKYIKENKKSALAKLMFKKLIWIDIKINDELPRDQFKVYSRKRKKDVTNEV